MATALSNRGGRGGLSEGPGHNAITWTEGTSEKDAKFKEQALPPAELAALKESRVLGVGKATPKQGDTQGSQSGALVGATAGGGGANAAELLPQHRAAVQRFFDRKK